MKKFLMILLFVFVGILAFAETYKVEKISGLVFYSEDLINDFELVEGLILDESAMMKITSGSVVEMSSIETGKVFIFSKPCRRERLAALVHLQENN